MFQIPKGEGEGAAGGNGADTHKPNGKGRKNGADKDDSVTGRQDKDGQEAAIDLTALKKGMPKAIKLEKELADARSDASKFYKKFAKECGLNTAQLKKAAKAYADEDTEAQRRKAEQMSLIFESCGA